MADEDTKRPSNSDFKQQTLRAWRPVLTKKTVLPTFFIVGAIFVVVGAVLLAQNADVEETVVDYTDCKQVVGPEEQIGKPCSELVGDAAGFYTDTNFPNYRCECTYTKTLSGFKDKDTFLYYGLTNFYQNHRRYVDSRSDPQLRNKQLEATSECDPIETNNDSTKFYQPCGLIANSLFNDTITIAKCNDAECTATTPLTLSGNDISWQSDRDVKFKNPGQECNDSAWENGMRPPNWGVDACYMGQDAEAPRYAADDTAVGNYTECEAMGPNRTADDDACTYNPWSSKYASSGHGYANEDLIVWMRTAALPTFRKLYRKVTGAIDSDAEYKITVGYNFPVASFKGEKRFILSTTSNIGGKNPFLGAAYLVVGLLSLVAGFVFLALGIKRPQEEAQARLENMKW